MTLHLTLNPQHNKNTNCAVKCDKAFITKKTVVVIPLKKLKCCFTSTETVGCGLDTMEVGEEGCYRLNTMEDSDV